MPKFVINYAFDCSCYGAMSVEADDASQAKRLAYELDAEDKLMKSWDPAPDCGVTDRRVIGIDDENCEQVVDGFSLDKTSELQTYRLTHVWSDVFTTYFFQCVRDLSGYYSEDTSSPPAFILDSLGINYESQYGESIMIQLMPSPIVVDCPPESSKDD